MANIKAVLNKLKSTYVNKSTNAHNPCTYIYSSQGINTFINSKNNQTKQYIIQPTAYKIANNINHYKEKNNPVFPIKHCKVVWTSYAAYSLCYTKKLRIQKSKIPLKI